MQTNSDVNHSPGGWRWLVYLLLFVSSSMADDWPQWRGPNRDGVWKEQDLSFPPEGVAVLWTVPAGGGYSSPVVSDGRVYAFDAELQNPRAWERLRCFDLNSGRLLWSQSNAVTYPDYGFDPDNGAGPNATCIVDEGRIYSIGANGDLFCRESRTGMVIWATNLTQSTGLRDYAAITPSPLIEAGLLITVPGGESNATVVAFDKTTGKERWRALNDSWTYSSPIVITVAGERQLIVWTPKAVTSLEPESGKILWRENITSPGDMVVSTPVFNQGYLLAGGLMFKLGPKSSDRKLLWPEVVSPTKRIFSNTSTPLIQNNLVFTGTTAGKLICVDRENGRQLWETNTVTAPGNGSCLSLTPLAELVLIFTDQGDLIRARLHESGYQEISRIHVIEPLHPFGGKKVVWVPPVFTHQSAILRNDAQIIRVDLQPTRQHPR